MIAGGDTRTAPSLKELVEQVGVPIEMLYVGTFESPLLVSGVRESRISAHVPELTVAPGVYGFREAGQWRGLVVDREEGQQHGEHFQSQLQMGTNLWAAKLLSRLGWEHGDVFLSQHPKFAAGDGVQIVGSAGDFGTVIGDPIPTKNGFSYRVRFGADSRNVPEDGLVAIEDTSSPLTWSGFPAAQLNDLLTLLTVVKTHRPFSDIVYSLGATRTIFRPYQFKPLLKLIQTSNPRLLIADEVGLGKTIEAGLIWTELNQRVGVRRALVVCPAALTRKWQSEMRRRFGVELEIADRRRLDEFASMLEEGQDPTFLAAISLESLRTAPVLERLNNLQPRFDLVVVDEAHYLRNRDTRSYALGDLLSDWADVFLFLSATPLNLGTNDLFNLLNLLADDQFPDETTFQDQLEPNRFLIEALRALRPAALSFPQTLQYLSKLEDLSQGRPLLLQPRMVELRERLEVTVDLTTAELARARRTLLEANTLSSTVTRTRKVDVPDAKATRVSQVIDVEWTDPELHFYNSVLEWARARAIANNGVVGFATIMPLRQAASCIPAMRQLLEEKYALTSMTDDFDEDIDFEDDASFSAEAMTSLDLRQALAGLGDVDTKFDVFIQRLREIRRSGISQIMVFSFFRRTLSYLERRLRNEFRVRVMDGSVPPAQRDAIMEAYRRGEFDVLLLSEVGSEGLDFEFVGALVNYDLPWNPMRVEQRIGRLDRFGQIHERIHIFNFHVPGTIETDIFERLYMRIRVFEEAIGELEPILRSEVGDITRLVLDPNRSEEERREQIERIAIAAENKRADLKQLEDQASGLFTGLDQLMIDGFEREVIDAGKFVGATEVQRIVTRFIESHHARIRRLPGGVVFEVEGSEDLQRRLVTIAQQRKDRRIEQLAGQLRAGESKFVVFDSQQSVSVSADLVVMGHPLTVAAVQDAHEESDARWRHGCVRLSGVGQGRAAVLLAVIEVTGAEPARELVGVAVTPDGVLAEEIIDPLLKAAANGGLEAGQPMGISEATVQALESLMHGRRHQIEEQRTRLNDAQITARSETIRKTYGSKIAKAQSTLDLVRGDNRAEKVLRIYVSRIANLKARCDADLEALEAKRKLTVTWEPVALIEVESTD